MINRYLGSFAIILLLTPQISSCASQKASGATTPAAAPEAAGKAHAATGAEPHPHQHPTAHHRFENAEAWAKKFEDPKRKDWQKPDQVVARLAITAKMKIADIGSGTGYFAVRLAKAAKEGQVWGVDIEASMVAYLNKRAAAEGLGNLKSIQATADDAKLPEAMDLVFICDTYHHLGKRIDYFKRVAQKLAPGGRLAIVDFKMGDIPVGPPERHRVTPEQMEQELKAAGFKRLSLELQLLPHQYLAVFTTAQP